MSFAQLLDQAAPAAQWTLQGPALLRHGTQCLEVLQGLRMTRSLALQERLLQQRAQLEQQRHAVCEGLLFSAIAGQQGPIKSALVALKRKLFNGQSLRDSDWAPLVSFGSLRARRQVQSLLLRQARVTRLEHAAAAAFGPELEACREQLRALVADPEFIKALQLSSPSLVHKAAQLAAKPAAQWRKAERQTEATVLRYLARAAVKTSPLGRWGAVAPLRIDPKAAAALVLQPAPPAGAQRAKSNLNLALCEALMRRLAERPELAGLQHYALNPSLHAAGDELGFFAPAGVGPGAPYTNLRRGTLPPPLCRALRSLPGPLPHAALLDTLAGDAALHHWSRAELSRWLDRLIRAGLLQAEPLVPNDTLRPLGLLADRLAEVDASSAATLRELEHLGRLFAGLEVNARQRTLQRIAALLQELGVDPDAHLPWVIEDCYSEAALGQLGADFARTLARDLGPWLDLLTQRDQDGLGLLMMKDLFVARYGIGGRCDQVFEFAADCVRRLASQPLSDASCFPRTAPVLAAQTRLMRELGRMARQAEGELQLQPAQLRALLERHGLAPLAAAPRSAAVNLQVLSSDAQALAAGDFDLVLNQALPGFGRFFTRYDQLFDDAGWSQSVREGVQRLQAQSGAEVLELLAVHAHNAQVHQPCTARALRMPGESSARQGLVDPNDLQLQHDAATDSLQFRLDGAAVLPLYLGFFHSHGLPAAHRVLMDAQSLAYQAEGLRPVDAIERRGPRDSAPSVRRYARIRLGRLVLQRECWAIDRAALPLPTPAGDDFAVFEHFQQWRREHGLPEQAYVRIARRRAGAAADLRDHKPIPVDMGSPLLLRSFLAGIDWEQVETLIWEEALPSPNASALRGATGSLVYELQLQLDQEACG